MGNWQQCALLFFLIALSGFRVQLIFKLLILGAFLDPFHRHLLSLSNESMTSLTYPKSYEFKIILYTIHLISREKDGYNLPFHFLNTSFCSTHSVFNPYIFVTGRNNSDQKASDGIYNFAVHYPYVSRQMIKNPAYFLLSISIAILFALKQHRKSNTRICSPSLISFVCITCLSIRSHCDLENPPNDLQVCGKKSFFLLSH